MYIDAINFIIAYNYRRYKETNSQENYNMYTILYALQRLREKHVSRKKSLIKRLKWKK